MQTGNGRRALGIVAALLFEALLLLALLTLGQSGVRAPESDLVVTRFQSRAVEPEPPAPEQEPQETQTAQPDTPEPSEPQPPPPAERKPALPQPEAAPKPVPDAPAPPVLIPLSRADLANLDNATRPAPAAPAPSRMGPADTRPLADTPRVAGTGPHGEPLYAASWYREPYDRELRGYLSAAQGPGWGLIACRTVADYRVEDCVMVDEYPNGSNIARSVLAAAWQFRVRPPRIGGQPKIGEWVRIRIDYDMRAR